ncbi:hypothetical protein HYDPIDRAFT_105194 [Hydnomerulius pinastri MD-312]|nr:hypothetical protein HYDPIDRAFT_105194 [Hydnomerulius pinastri MD-312]
MSNQLKPLLVRAALGEPTERAPVWIMRQAGRHLPEFRALKERDGGHSFFEICQTPALAKEVTLQPIYHYQELVDAAIIFSDILVIPQALGMEVEMNPGPSFPQPLKVPADIDTLKQNVDVKEALGYMFEALKLTRKELDDLNEKRGPQNAVALIGFCGAPWTLMAYMIDGGSSRTLQKAKTWLFKHPQESHKLLARITEVCVAFLIGQVEAGAQLLQVFDSHAGDLSSHDFETFSLPYLTQIAQKVREGLKEQNLSPVPLTLFAKGAPPALAAKAGYNVIGLHWANDPRDPTIPKDVVLQGNLDNAVLLSGEEAITREVQRMCQQFREARPQGGWIANLGHGMLPEVDPENAKIFFQQVQQHSKTKQ